MSSQPGDGDGSSLPGGKGVPSLCLVLPKRLLLKHLDVLKSLSVFIPLSRFITYFLFPRHLFLRASVELWLVYQALNPRALVRTPLEAVGVQATQQFILTLRVAAQWTLREGKLWQGRISVSPQVERVSVTEMSTGAGQL